MSLDDRKKLVRQHIDLTRTAGTGARRASAQQGFSTRAPLSAGRWSVPSFSTWSGRSVTPCRSWKWWSKNASPKATGWSPSTLIGTIEHAAFGYPPSDKVLSISAMAFWTITPTQQVQEICTMFDMESFRAQLGLETRPFAEKALP